MIDATALLRAFASFGPPSFTPRALAAASATFVRVLIIARSFSASAANRCRMNGSTSTQIKASSVRMALLIQRPLLTTAALRIQPLAAAEEIAEDADRYERDLCHVSAGPTL